MRLAVGKVELAGVGPLGHHLKRRVGRAADHRHAHELVAEALHLGLDHSRQVGNVGHATLQLEIQKSLGPGPLGPSLRHLSDVEERAAI